MANVKNKKKISGTRAQLLESVFKQYNLDDIALEYVLIGEDGRKIPITMDLRDISDTLIRIGDLGDLTALLNIARGSKLSKDVKLVKIDLRIYDILRRKQGLKLQKKSFKTIKLSYEPQLAAMIFDFLQIVPKANLKEIADYVHKNDIDYKDKSVATAYANVRAAVQVLIEFKLLNELEKTAGQLDTVAEYSISLNKSKIPLFKELIDE